MSTDRDCVTVPGLAARKASAGDDRIVMVTAYDHPSAVIADRAGVDVLLVGDSLGMVVQGRPDTLKVTIDHVVYHVQCVTRAAPRALVVADLPWLSYHVSPEETLRNAGRCIQEGGAGAVKLEGGEKRADAVRALVNAEIPVMGHVGLTPQSVHVMGGFRVQGGDAEAAERIRRDARALEEAGAFAIVLEGVPAPLANELTGQLQVPTIGIGAGAGCDGQVLVWHDLLGITPEPSPRFVRRYEELGQRAEEALRRYAADVRDGDFPTDAESYGVSRGPRAAENG